MSTDTVLDIAQLTRTHAREMVDVIHEIAVDPMEKASDRLRAANMILDRGYGTPTQSVIQIPMERQRRIEEAKFTDAQLEHIIRSSPEFLALQAVAEEAEYADPALDPLLA
jgi:hypothetical protein